MSVSLEVAMKVKTPGGLRTRYVMEQQAWQRQGEQWRIVVAKHSDLLKMRPALKPIRISTTKTPMPGQKSRKRSPQLPRIMNASFSCLVATGATTAMCWTRRFISMM